MCPNVNDMESNGSFNKKWLTKSLKVHSVPLLHNCIIISLFLKKTYAALFKQVLK